MVEVRSWQERDPRSGWTLTYTWLGGISGQVRKAETFRGLDAATAELIGKLTSQALLAVTEFTTTREHTEATRFFCAVATKLLQRGRNPALFDPDLPAAPRSLTRDSILYAAIGPLTTSKVNLDTSFHLHPTYEAELFHSIQRRFPTLQRFTHPQAPIEALLDDRSATGEQWADFLVAPPLPEAQLQDLRQASKGLVIELDGRQHERTKVVDKRRDGFLEQAGFRVERVFGREGLAAGSSMFRLLEGLAKALPDTNSTHAALSALHAPCAATRVGIALVELLRTGALAPGGDWSITLHDEFAWGTDFMYIPLEILWSVDQVWQTGVRPRSVTVNTRRWVLEQDGYIEVEKECNGIDVEETVAIYLEPFTPPWAPLPSTSLPAVVIRNAFVPAPLQWLQQEALPRRHIAESAGHVSPGIERLAKLMFGITEFREGQDSAIRHCLAGIDTCVLLPTGAGKSLIFQLAGLLLPGVTIVVDPLVALVDDQVLRLQQLGIDRAIGLSSVRQTKAHERDAVKVELAHGQVAFAFFAPERLHIKDFRDALAAAAKHHTVNLIVIDEAHCVSEWGHDFRPAYLRVGRTSRLLSRDSNDSEAPLVALTGTASPGVLRDIVLELQGPRGGMKRIRPSTFNRPNLSYEVLEYTDAEMRTAIHEAVVERVPAALGLEPSGLLARAGTDTKSGIVFVPHTNGQFGVEGVRSILTDALTKSTSITDVAQWIGIYSGRSPKSYTSEAWTKAKALQAAAFKDNDVPILVSTKAFGMGIDKPNIRWTLHVGYPSSLEAFAQESGRAGRDGQASRCILIALPPDPDFAGRLLGPRVDWETRISRYEAANKARLGSDLMRQFYFLSNNHPGVESELERTGALLAQLLDSPPGSQATLPRASSDDNEKSQERALMRLAWVGIVDDYTIDYGAGKLVVDLADYNEQHIDQKVLEFVRRVQPGRLLAHQEAIASAPPSIHDRARHHLGLLLTVLYSIIGPARVRALAEMHIFATSGEADSGLRRRIIAYLSDGPIAGILDQVATGDTIEIREATRLLELEPLDPHEWIGATSRLLETYPDHPILLIVRALGEALLDHPDRSVVRDNFRTGLVQLDAYNVHQDREFLLNWLAAQLRNQLGGRSWPLVIDLYNAWIEAGQDESTLDKLLDKVLKVAVASTSQRNANELAYVLQRRARHWSAFGQRLALQLEGRE